MKISVVIPAFNEERLLGESLLKVKAASSAFAQLAWPTELIVCDNNSTDRTAELARAAGATVVFEPVNQIARARNTGATAASGDWILFVDADSHPTAELFSEVAQEILSGRTLAGGCTVKLAGNHSVANRVVSLWNALSRARRLMAGSFIFCEAAAFREVGGFSHEFFVGEEIDLSIRLKRLARKTGKRLVILHRHPLTTSARKVHLYKPWEHLWFITKTILCLGRTARKRDACFTWYDGRR